MMQIDAVLWTWLAFNTVLPLLPVPLVWLGNYVFRHRSSVFAIIRDGQLCFYSTATASVFLKDALSVRATQTAGDIALICFASLLLIVISIFIYGWAVGNADGIDARSERKLGWTS